MTPWIQNISASDCKSGNHFNCGDNSMLIQISDPVTKLFFATPWFPKPAHTFKEIHQFQFFDQDELPGHDELLCSDEQAQQLVELLQHALEERMQVVVHCFAGVCRSGAVAEVGIMMGFTDTEAFRLPNVRVKTKMMKVLGWTYDT